MSILMPILVVLHILVCLLLVLVVLMQRPRSEGLGSAFGGGITDNVFGSQTTNVLARFTTWMAIAFFGITLLLSILTAKMHGGTTEIQKKLLSAPAPESVAPAVGEKSAEAPSSSGLDNAVAPEATPAPEPAPNEQAAPTAVELAPVVPTPTEQPAPAPTEAPIASPAEPPQN
jgi:preprotein translocase subunit SecG